MCIRCEIVRANPVSTNTPPHTNSFVCKCTERVCVRVCVTHTQTHKLEQFVYGDTNATQTRKACFDVLCVACRVWSSAVVCRACVCVRVLCTCCEFVFGVCVRCYWVTTVHKRVHKRVCGRCVFVLAWVALNFKNPKRPANLMEVFAAQMTQK